jgi:hypothetical protein
MSITDYGGGNFEAVNRAPSRAPVAKVTASTVSTGVGGSIAIVIVGILKRSGYEISLEELGALVTLFGCASSFIGGYMTPPNGFRRMRPVAEAISRR